MLLSTPTTENRVTTRNENCIHKLAHADFTFEVDSQILVLLWLWAPVFLVVQTSGMRDRFLELATLRSKVVFLIIMQRMRFTGLRGTQ
jgi:hypothetical protein